MNFERGFFPITAGVLAEGQVSNKLYYIAGFRKGYTRNFFIPKENLLTAQKESRGHVFEAGMELVFADRNDQGSMKIVTSSTSYGNYISERYFTASCDVRKYWSLSGGIMQYQAPSYLMGRDSVFIQSGTSRVYPSSEYYLHSNINTFGGYAGLTWRKIKKAAVISDGWRYKRFYSTRFYIHMLFAGSKAEDILYNNITYQVDNIKQVPFGYRIGWMWDQMGTVTGLELGKIPHAAIDAGQEDDLKLTKYYNYFRLTFHFMIINTDKQYKLSQK